VLFRVDKLCWSDGRGRSSVPTFSVHSTRVRTGRHWRHAQSVPGLWAVQRRSAACQLSAWTICT